MLTHLSLARFKSWREIRWMRLAPITALFGPNSSGKTSLLQFLLLLKQTVESSDRAQVLELGDERSLANLGNFRATVYGHERPGSMSFELGWQLPAALSAADPEHGHKRVFLTDRLSFRCSLDEHPADRLSVSELIYQADSCQFGLRRGMDKKTGYNLVAQGTDFSFVRAQGRPAELPPPVKFYGFPDQVYTRYQNAGFLGDLQVALEELANRTYYLGPLREFPQRHYAWKGSEPADMGRRGERVVDAILAAGARQAYISPGKFRRKVTLEERLAHWLKELGLIASFSVTPVAAGSSIYQVKVRKEPDGAEVLVTDVGFGVSQILPVLALCYYVPEGSILLIEQPEIHLHPSVQSGLADVFVDAVKTRKVQIIVESHSEHLLRRLQRRVAEQKLDPKQAALYFCESGATGSRLLPLELDLYGNISNWPKDFFADEFSEMRAMSEAMLRRQKAEATAS